MKILYINLIYPKNILDSNLYKDLAYQLAADGHEITIVTLNENKQTKLEIENTIKVLRVSCGRYFNVTNKQKIITALTLPYILWRNIKKYLGEETYNVILYPSFPINFRIEFLINKIKKYFNAKSYYIHRDHFPYNAVDLNMLKKGLLYKYFRWEEKRLLNISDLIGCMSPKNIEFIIKKNKTINLINKLHLLQNWGENIKNNSNKIDNDIIRKKNGYTKDDFIVIFGGNMGKPQGLEMLEKIIKTMKNEKNIKFLLIGRGTEKEKLKEKTKNNKNVRILDYIPREEYLNILKICNLGIVMLDKKFTVPNFPSKTTEYLKEGIPILAAIDKITDYGEILKNEMKAGDYVIHGEINEYCQKLKDLYLNRKKLEYFSNNGREYYGKKLQVKMISKILESKLEEI